MTDILAALEAVMERNTRHYRSDFELDRAMLRAAAVRPDREARHLLWMSRPCGTECFYERDVYIRERYAHQAWLYHAESGEPCIAYAVEILGLEEGRVMGELYPLDLRRHTARVKREALSEHTVVLAFADGCEGTFPAGRDIQDLTARHGEVVRRTMLPEQERELEDILHHLRARRRENQNKEIPSQS